jgi:hypothetical protein
LVARNEHHRRDASLFNCSPISQAGYRGLDCHLTLVAQAAAQSFSFVLSIPVFDSVTVPLHKMLCRQKTGGGYDRNSQGLLGQCAVAKCGNLGNTGNVESVTCRPHYPGDGTNPPLSALLKSIAYVLSRGGLRSQQAKMA